MAAKHSSRPTRLTFCLEGTPATAASGTGTEPGLGHLVYEEQLRRAAADHPDVEPHWVHVQWNREQRWEHWRLFEDNWSLRGSIKGLRALRRDSHDVAYVHTQNLGLFSCGPLGVAHRSPVVLSMDVTPLQMDAMADAYGHRLDPAPIEKAKWFVNRLAYRGAARVVTTSAWTKDSLVRDYGVADEHVAAIPWGVDVAWWEPRPIPRRGPPRILFAGGDLRRKGADLLIDAVRGPLAGSTELDVVTNAPCDEGAGVHVHAGLRPGSEDLRARFHGADIFAMPSRADCTPYAVIEALAAGLPVVSTTVGAIPEMVEDGVSGVLVPPDDPGALVAALRALIDDPSRRQAMAEAARARAVALFDGVANAGRVIDVCVEAASRQ